MANWIVKVSLFLNYIVFAILLNSVGTVILQVQNTYGVSESRASILEAFKDLSIAITSFAVASFVTRLGYKRTMLFALGFVALACLAMPQLPTFWMTKLLFAATGIGFALVKVSVFASLGLVTRTRKEHVSLMNFLESFFMLGVLSGYFVFGAFVNDANPASLAWLHVYYLLAGIAVTAMVLLLAAPLDESSVQSQVTGTFAQDFVGMLNLCLRPLVLVFIVSAFLYVLVEQSIMTWLPTFNSHILHLSASLSIQMTSILAASTALGRFIAGVVLKRLAWFNVLVTCLLCAATLVLVTLPLARMAESHATIDNWLQAPIAAFVFPLIGLCIAPVYPAINSVMLSALPQRQHAAMSGLIVVFSALGGTTGSIITGTLFQIFSGTTAFYCSLVPITAILVALYMFKQQTDVLAPQEADGANLAQAG